jgi:hypothetical protein
MVLYLAHDLLIMTGLYTMSEKLCSYVMFKSVLVRESYLSSVQTCKYKIALTPFRVSAHDLLIERGRYVNMKRHDRICTCCNMNMLENEYHFLLVCPAFLHLRKPFLSLYFCHWPSLHTSVLLMSFVSHITQNKLAKFVYHSFKLRQLILCNLSLK